MPRELTPVLVWSLFCLAFPRSSTVSGISLDDGGPPTSYSDAEFSESFASLDATSRGLLFPSFRLGDGVVGNVISGISGDQLATPGSSEARPDLSEQTVETVESVESVESDRGFLTEVIGQYLDKFGNEIRILCWNNGMCANNADGKTSCYRGRCVECTSSSDCTDVLSPVCDTVSKTCVQCTSTRDCASGVCSSNNVCVECTSNSRCSGRGTYIDFICSTYAGNAREQLLMNTCAECVVNSDCPYRMICAGNTCSCTSDAQCDSPQPYCYEGRCQSCPGSTTIGHGVCSSTIVGGTCQLRESTSEVYRCVECETASDCGGAACVDGSCSCMSHGCADGLYCDKVTEKCVECLQDAQCMDPEAPYCGPLGQCVQCTGVDVTCRKEITLGMVTCNQAYGTCEPMCDSDADCLMDARPYCDPTSMRCAPCRNDGDCSQLAPYCLAGEVEENGVTVTAPRCVQCQRPGSADDCPSGMVCNQLNFCASCSSNDDCPRDRPICSADTRSCVTCDDDAGLYCPRQRPICQSGQCLGCEYHSDCGSVMKCDQKTNRCELCLNDEDCTSIYGESRRYCSNGTCQECRGDKDCSYQFPHCDSGGSCVQCSASVPCDNGGICDVGSGRCVDCLSDAQCHDSLPYCIFGRCAECQNDTQCAVGSCIDGLCKECDKATAQVCSSVVQKYFQSCSQSMSCESTVEVGSAASVLRVDPYGS